MYLCSTAISNPGFNFEHFQSRMAFHRRTGSIPTSMHQESGYQFNPDKNPEATPHHHHQVLYVCRGHCSGPQCDFSQSLKQWHSTVWLDKDNQVEHSGSPFGSQVMASAPKALEKLDQKRETLKNLKNVLAQKIENKAKNRERKLKKEQQRAASAMDISNRSHSRLYTQDRPASAMVLHKSNSLSKRNNYASITEGMNNLRISFVLVHLVAFSSWK